MEGMGAYSVDLRSPSAQLSRMRWGWCFYFMNALFAIPPTTRRGGGPLAGVRCHVRLSTPPQPLGSQVVLLWVLTSSASATTPVASVVDTPQSTPLPPLLLALSKAFPWLISPPIRPLPSAPGECPGMGSSPAGGAAGPLELASPLLWAVDHML